MLAHDNFFDIFLLRYESHVTWLVRRSGIPQRLRRRADPKNQLNLPGLFVSPRHLFRL